MFLPCPAEEQLSFGELQERTRMSKEDLMRVLHSLACAKYKVGTLLATCASSCAESILLG